VSEGRFEIVEIDHFNAGQPDEPRVVDDTIEGVTPGQPLEHSRSRIAICQIDGNQCAREIRVVGPACKTDDLMSVGGEPV
jgi:hypothetical protein